MKRIGLLVDALSHPYQNEILLAAHEESVRADVSLYCLAGGEIDIHHARNSIYDLVGEGDFSGIIVCSGTMARAQTTAQLASFVRRFAPLPLTSISIELDAFPSVVIDNVSGIRELTRHLIEVHGRRRIAFVQVRTPEGELRFAGYRSALSDCGLPLDPDLLVPGEFTWEAGVNAVDVLFDQRKTPCDAIVGANDWIAIGALDALRRRGIRVPEQVALTGFDDVDEARFSHPAITTVYQPVRELGIEAFRLTLRQIERQDVPLITRVATRTEYRESCGCVLSERLDAAVGPPSSRAQRSDLSHERERVSRALVDVAPSSKRMLQNAWAPGLFDALVADLLQQTSDAFLSALRALLTHVQHDKRLGSWQRVILVLRARMLPLLTAEPRASAHAESLFEQAHMLIAAQAERAQGRIRWEREHLMNVLNAMSAELRRAFDHDAAIKVLVKHLGKLDVPSCFVALQPERPSPGAESRLIMAYDDRLGTEVELCERAFRSGDLIPVDVRPARRHTMVMEPLWFGDDARGFCALEMGSPLGIVYETIREQLSSAFYAARLLRAMVDETTRREQAERARLEGEMRLAERIQTGILPRDCQVKGFQIATDMQPAAEVGGDYFDILPFEGGCWLGIGDVAGHGLDTGLIMLMIQGIVAGAVCQRPEASPRWVWRSVNSVVYENVRRRLDRDEHATLMLLRCSGGGRVTYAGAHEDLLIFRRGTGTVEVAPSSGIWVGILPEVEEEQIDEREVALMPGDVLLLYTDGLTEALHPERGMFGVERLMAELRSVGLGSVEAIRDHVLRATRRWAPELTDDRTLVVLRYLGAPA